MFGLQNIHIAPLVVDFDKVTLGLAAYYASALLADFMLAATDGGVQQATSISTKVMSRTVAAIIGFFCNLAGALMISEVAETIAKGFVKPEYQTLAALSAVIACVIIGSGIAWIIGTPGSKTYMIVASFVGAGYAVGGWDALESTGAWRTAEGFKLAIEYGVPGSFVLALISYLMADALKKGPRKWVFRWLQAFSATGVLTVHGYGDTQKIMALITAGMMRAGLIAASTVTFKVPVWEVIVPCALVMGLGTALMSRAITKTVGDKIVNKMRPRDGFAAECVGAIIIGYATWTGDPVSTSMSMVWVIVGMGLARGLYRLPRRSQWHQWKSNNLDASRWYTAGIIAGAMLAEVQWVIMGRIVLMALGIFFVCPIGGYLLTKLFSVVF